MAVTHISDDGTHIPRAGSRHPKSVTGPSNTERSTAALPAKLDEISLNSPLFEDDAHPLVPLVRRLGVDAAVARFQRENPDLTTDGIRVLELRHLLKFSLEEHLAREGSQGYSEFLARHELDRQEFENKGGQSLLSAALKNIMRNLYAKEGERGLQIYADRFPSTFSMERPLHDEQNWISNLRIESIWADARDERGGIGVIAQRAQQRGLAFHDFADLMRKFLPALAQELRDELAKADEKSAHQEAVNKFEARYKLDEASAVGKNDSAARLDAPWNSFSGAQIVESLQAQKILMPFNYLRALNAGGENLRRYMENLARQDPEQLALLNREVREPFLAAKFLDAVLHRGSDGEAVVGAAGIQAARGRYLVGKKEWEKIKTEILVPHCRELFNSLTGPDVENRVVNACALVPTFCAALRALDFPERIVNDSDLALSAEQLAKLLESNQAQFLAVALRGCFAQS